MSNYEANPVGFLYERYQSSGVSPLYEVFVCNFYFHSSALFLLQKVVSKVVMSRGQAHAPVFTARLTVPQVFDYSNVTS